MTVEELIKMFKCNVNHEVFIGGANLKDEGEYSVFTITGVTNVGQRVFIETGEEEKWMKKWEQNTNVEEES